MGKLIVAIGGVLAVFVIGGTLDLASPKSYCEPGGYGCVDDLIPEPNPPVLVYWNHPDPPDHDQDKCPAVCPPIPQCPAVELSKLLTCPAGQSVTIGCNSNAEHVLKEHCHLVAHPKDPGDWELCTLRVKRPARTR